MIDQKKATRVEIEYNWRPPRCSKCKVFGHSDSTCPKLQTKEQHKGVAVWLQRTDAQVNSKDNNDNKEKPGELSDVNFKGSNEELPCVQPIPSNGASCGDNTNKEDAQHEDEGWEVPKRKHTCRARVENQSTTSQVGDKQGDGYVDDSQCRPVKLSAAQDQSLIKDKGQDRSKLGPNGVELDRGLDPPN
ncbi:hypothetical protein AQUCO_04800008v1 [Aquilegia coerulea]|uniref:Zinc knuckle CX2CX4HX4C domain-containing protein n=1 Tax=Aquilegia coerulea TaxID=218851 RepID=A0A2G5CKM7_AQUCA|nr:hypothetical protein AQUCO_04800008v1 [Aquilegia coerulea]